MEENNSLAKKAALHVVSKHKPSFKLSLNNLNGNDSFFGIKADRKLTLNFPLKTAENKAQLYDKSQKDYENCLTDILKSYHKDYLAHNQITIHK